MKFGLDVSQIMADICEIIGVNEGKNLIKFKLRRAVFRFVKYVEATVKGSIVLVPVTAQCADLTES